MRPGPLIDKLQLWRDQIDLVGLEACPLSEWLHRHLVVAGFNAVCVETRHAQRFLSTLPVKTDKNDARGIAEIIRVGHYRPVPVKSAEAQLIRTTLQARRQIVATLLQIQGSIRGLLRMHASRSATYTATVSTSACANCWGRCPSLTWPLSHCCGCGDSCPNGRHWTIAWGRPPEMTRCACG